MGLVWEFWAQTTAANLYDCVQCGKGRVSSEDPLGLSKRRSKWRASSDNPKPLLMEKAFFDNALNIPKGKD